MTPRPAALFALIFLPLGFLSAPVRAQASSQPAEAFASSQPAAAENDKKASSKKSEASQKNNTAPSSQPVHAEQDEYASSQPAHAEQDASSQPAHAEQDEYASSQPAHAKQNEYASSQPAPQNVAVPAPSSITAQGYTSRPGMSDTTAVLPHGRFLAQAGFALSSQLGSVDGRLADQTLTVPDLSLRFGIFDWMEARFSTAYDIAPGATATAAPQGAIGKAAPGVHIRVLDEGEYWPALAISGDLLLPVATLSLSDMEADMRMSLSKSFLDIVGVGSTLQVGWHDKMPTFDYTLAGSLDLGEGVITFVELFGRYNAIPLALPSLWIDAGLSFAINDAVALDIYAGVNAAGEPSSYFIASGVSFLLPEL